MTMNIDAIILYGYGTKPNDDSTVTYPCDFPACGDTIHVPMVAIKDASAVIALIKQQAAEDDETIPDISLKCVCTSHMMDLRDQPRAIVGHPAIEFELRKLGVTS